MEYISYEHSDVWRILDRSNYNNSEADDIEKMYKFMHALKEYAGSNTMRAISMYSEVYSVEFQKVADKLSE